MIIIMRRKSLIALSFIICQLSFSPAWAQTKNTEVLFETTAGNIRIALYDETPLTRDNFLKITKMGVYDSLLIHRVIKNFMIQSGDTNSKHAKPGQLLGSGDFDYTTEAEFRLPQIFHRRGVVAMARESDKMNPERRSSACQFYIVWGKIFDDKRLAKIQERLDSATQGAVKLTPEMMEIYKTIGGTPHLDGQYTVFGEVIEGMDVVEKIQGVQTDKNDRPLEDIRILKATVTKDLPQPKPEKKAPAKKPVKKPVRKK
jgi:peptidyl-prolyl cis-trans isomerase B (cyclophilin B)